MIFPMTLTTIRSPYEPPTWTQTCHGTPHFTIWLVHQRGSWCLMLETMPGQCIQWVPIDGHTGTHWTDAPEPNMECH
jgi:hypothetical protein